MLGEGDQYMLIKKGRGVRQTRDCGRSIHRRKKRRMPYRERGEKRFVGDY